MKSNATSTSSSLAGGVCAFLINGNITNSFSNNNDIQAYGADDAFSGGVVAFQNTSTKVSYCDSENNKISSFTSSVSTANAIFSGGVSGYIIQGISSFLNSRNNTINAISSATALAGGVHAYVGSGNTVSNCNSQYNLINSSSVVSSSYASGITGYLYYSNLLNCNSLANTISAKSSASIYIIFSGGIAARVISGSVSSSVSSNNTISAFPTNLNITYSGGITGKIDLYNNTNCNSTYNTITGYFSGGIVSFNNATLTNGFYGSNSFVNSTVIGQCVAVEKGTSIGCLDLFPASTTGQPTTGIPSTTSPTTTIPSTTPPTTGVPSTLQASSTTPPTTGMPSTTSPTTGVSSTFQVTTEIASTFQATTGISTTSLASTNIPTTITPTTDIPSTHIASTFAPSSMIPTTVPPVACLYNVPNCQNCGSQGIVVDVTLYNISCVFSGDKWIYSFKSLVSNTTFVTQVVTLNGSVLIDGNLNQTSDSTLVIILSNENKNGALNVTGCVTINGNISLILNQEISNGNETFALISYNCSENINISNSQVVVDANYENSKCDSIISQVNNNQNSLSVSISSIKGKNCGKKISSGVIIGIIFGVVGVGLVVVAIISVILYRRRREINKMISTVGNEMSEMK